MLDIENFECDDALISYLQNLYNDIKSKYKGEENKVAHSIFACENLEGNENFAKL